ncbi:MAG: transketolase [Clostridia bacterium]|nr:transketolase [Clostridia bacterium]
MKNDNLCVNSIRLLSMDAINNAKSGHPGIALGAAPILYSLYGKIMNVSPKAEKHLLRDRFVMSAGHGSALLYATLHSLGFSFSKNDLKNFRTVNSRCPGHPECESDNAIDASTGPLGQGLANAVGMAIAEKHLASIFNKPDYKLFDNYTYCLVGDGCLMEGISHEALSLAGTLKLNKLIVIYDSNNVSLDAKTNVAFTQNTKQVFLGYGFNVIEVKDGNNVDKITAAIKKAKNSSKPSLVIVNTVIGYGSSLAGSNKVHGAPLGDDETLKLRAKLGVVGEPFEINTKAQEYFETLKARYDSVKKEFDERMQTYKKHYPSDYRILNMYLKNDFSDIDNFVSKLENKNTSTRVASGEILNCLAENYSNLIGGCADVMSSTKAQVYSANFHENPVGRNIMFGVREFAMGAIANGLSLYGCLTPFVSTFMVFADYLKPALRMSALTKQRVLYILTHDSLMVGKDGPTHQPIEQMAMFRSQPNTYTFRPCDYTETCASYAVALNKFAPSVLVLTRQDLEPMTSNYEKAKQGAYILKEESKKLDAVLIATGSEVKTAIDVQQELEAAGFGVRVVSMPCMELFDEQTNDYKEKVLGKDVPTFAIELSSDLSFYKYIKAGEVIGTTTFGLSGSPDDVLKEFKLDTKSIVARIKKQLKK